MKKVIIIGHKQSNYQDVEKVFQCYGMSPPIPSKREKMSPIEIGHVLNKVLPSLEDTPKNISLLSNKKSKIKKGSSSKNKSHKHTKTKAIQTTSSIWDNLSLDLMLANIEQNFWGWSDPNAIQILDYWANLDPNIHFVFVYDKPENLFQYYSLEEAIKLDKHTVQEKFEEWQTYNEKILTYFNKYKDRSVLLNTQQLQNTKKTSLSEIYKHISAPDALVKKLSEPSLNKEMEIIEVNQELSHQEECPLSHFIVSQIIKNSPTVTQVYEELQSHADLPYISEQKLVNDTDFAFLAWKDMIQKQIDTNQYQYEKELELNTIKEHQLETNKKYQLAEQELLEKQKEIEQIKDENEKVKSEKVKLNEHVQSTHKMLSEKEKEIACIKNENISAQEEIQEKFQEANKRKQELEQELKAISDKKALLEAENSQKTQLSESLENENKALLEQIQFIQEELEKLYLDNQTLKAKPRLYGAADRIKNQLTYRLGYKIQKHGKSLFGIIFLPFILFFTYLGFKREMKKYEWNTLPPIHEYEDVHEANRIKSHLSYKLGVIFLQEINNPFKWLTLPYKLIKEGKRFKQG
ncbi:protein HyaE [Pasteurella multocida]|uniref:protein HyaE n=1 Tax=Pasteurella multocida TaxID=747 RepID=UPI00061A7AA9|nr:protein HyaE [Pasteurella multocida]AKD39596.1 protein HyaE [Pasteurella multocida OH1905]MEB3486223.1 protein HyaE [Pasteurella multocida]URJ98152.1 protein HyaE [Pasteurella multocida]URK00657.1 protein HyaE [Pasteurella multocida]HDR1123327.1 protein HyaE [Pasteurella multocida]